MEGIFWCLACQRSHESPVAVAVNDSCPQNARHEAVPDLRQSCVEAGALAGCRREQREHGWPESATVDAVEGAEHYRAQAAAVLDAIVPVLAEALPRVLADPGGYVKREFTPSDYGGTDAEPLHLWQARAVLALLADVQGDGDA